MSRKKESTKRQELISNIRRLRRNISRRLSNLEKLADRESDAMYGEVYRHFRGRYENEIVGYGKLSPKMSIKDLKDIEKQLYRFDIKQATTVKGFKNYTYVYARLKIYNIPEEEIYPLYDRLVEENGLLEYYKYEVLQTITDARIKGLSDAEIAENIRALYEKIYTGESKNWKDALEQYEQENPKFYDM